MRLSRHGRSAAGSSRRLVAALLALALAACATVPDSAEEAALRERPQQPRMHAELVRGMLAQGKYHAALAHIEELERAGEANPRELRWLRALSLYKLGQLDEARQAYQGLLKTDYAGQAHHGLGLIAARSNLRQAVRYFNQAVKLRPTDAEIRNDLGYTLLLAGRLTEARHHLATATELAPGEARAQSNLVLSFLLEGREAEAQSLARSLGIDAEQQRQLAVESQLIKRLVAQRAEEFTAKEEVEVEVEDDSDGRADERPLPGLYRRAR